MSEPSKVWRPTLESRIALLQSDLEAGQAEQIELPVQDLPVECHVGVDSGGSAWIRITCDPASVSLDDRSASVRFSIRANGYQVTVSPVVVKSVAIHFLEEVIDLLSAGHSPGDCGRAALQNWRELLARPAGTPLSENALVGLFGELEVLETILRHGGRLEHWTGWDKDHADFRLPGLVIEVKSTTSSNYRRVRIHGLGQLADPQDGSELILVLRRLESSPEGHSVPDLIDQIVRLGASRSVLLDRLSQMSYSEQHQAQYERYKFASQELALRLIDDHHPRLVPQMLADVDLSSIDKIDYELNLNGDAEADLENDLESLIADHLGTP